MDVQTDLDELQKKEEQEIKERQEKINQLDKELAEKQARNEALEKEEARRKENLSKITEEKKTQEQIKASDDSQIQKLREENKEKVFEKIAKENSYTPEQKKALIDSFSKYDSGAITEDKIYQDAQTAHIVLNKDKYLSLEKKLYQGREGAGQWTAQASNSASAGAQPSDTGAEELTELDMQAIKFTGMSPERYKELKAKGKI